MIVIDRNRRVEFGDFQTPDDLANRICLRLHEFGANPDIVIEPTCGVGAFVVAAMENFSHAKQIIGFDINSEYLQALHSRVHGVPRSESVYLETADFFSTIWKEKIDHLRGELLVIGNFPWVTNATQGAMGADNLPKKSNFLGFNGFDAISGKANFDISEWMLIEVLRWFTRRAGYVAMLVKTAVARKVLAHAERQKAHVHRAFIANIDAKMYFGASVDASLLVIHLAPDSYSNYDYSVYSSLDDFKGKRVGHRQGLTVGDLDSFETYSYLLGKSPQKWRSGIKHDAAAVMELSRTPNGYKNGLGEFFDLEDLYLFPLLKGSDIGSHKDWREKFVIVPQRLVGNPTLFIQTLAPKTWAYLQLHGKQLDSRMSTIYKKNPRFSIFGVGDYAFRPWRIAICGLYKSLQFRLIGPIEGKPVMFDDTVCYVSFDTESQARDTLQLLTSEPYLKFVSSLVFWDEKRPIKSSMLNLIDWSRLNDRNNQLPLLSLTVTTSTQLENKLA